MREVMRSLRVPAPYAMNVSSSVTEARTESRDVIGPSLSEPPPPVTCISCGARRQTNGEMPCEH